MLTSELRLGDLLAISTVYGISTIVWALSRDGVMNVRVVDYLDPGDLCMCIDPDPFFKGYLIIATTNGIMGYVCDTHVTLVRRNKAKKA